MIRPIALAAAISVMVLAAASPGTSAEMTRPDGKTAFDAACRPCHGPVGPGTYMLERRVGKDHALLTERDDLTGDYIRAVVRNGLNGMLAYRKTEVTDAELDAIIGYLTHASDKDTQ